MTGALLIDDIERKSEKISFQNVVVDLLTGNSDAFKDVLKAVADYLENNFENLNDLKFFDNKELTTFHRKFRIYSTMYDKLNDMYHAENYFHDQELKLLFKTINRNLHKIENVSYRYLMKDGLIDLTPVYLKEGVSKLSQEAMSSKSII